MRVKSRIAPALLLFVLPLTGCVPAVGPAAGGPSASATPTPSRTPNATPTPTPTASEAPVAEVTRPSLSDLVITVDGLGPLEYGQAPPDGDPETDVLVYDDDYCNVNGVVSGTWIPPYPGVPSVFRAEEAPFIVSVQDGVIEEIAVVSPDIATDRGVRVGSTLAEVQAAYPDAYDGAPDTNDVALYTIEGPDSRLVMELLLGAYGSSFGVTDAVWNIRVEPLGTPIQRLAGTDSGINACPSTL